MSLRSLAQAMLTIGAVGAALWAAPSARALETLSVGAVGSPNAVLWPEYIAEEKGFYADEGLKIDLVYSQSSAVVLQALTSGSTQVAIAAGLADPIHAVLRGAGVAVVRIDGQVGPYALMAKKTIHSIKDLKGKKVSIDEAHGTTMVYFTIMLHANHMSRKDCEFLYAGATAARSAALESGTSDAAMITAPQLFRAQAEGFVNLGYSAKYAPDVPFTSEVVNRAWAASHKEIVKKFLTAYGKAIAWFDDTKNRTAAIDILEKVEKTDRSDIANSYDLFKKINYFEKSDVVSPKKVAAYVKAQELVDGPLKVDMKKLVLEIK